MTCFPCFDDHLLHSFFRSHPGSIPAPPSSPARTPKTGFASEQGHFAGHPPAGPESLAAFLILYHYFQKKFYLFH